jgi:anti-sigma regulatory factor (Ser/Thr protein kinase)
MTQAPAASTSHKTVWTIPSLGSERRMASEPSSEIVLRAELAELARIERWVAGLAAECRLPPALAHRLDLCVTELVTNIIGYAFPDGVAGTITIRFWCQPDHFVVSVDDDGTPFDPTSYTLPDLPRSLADATIGGWGIRLVRQFADELRYRRSATANQLTLVLRR